MDVLIPLGIITIIILFSIKRFKPQMWQQLIAKFKK